MPRNPYSLVMSIDESVEKRESLALAGKKLVVTNGCFDILHRGHAEYLNIARGMGDALWVLLNSDNSVGLLKGDSRPIIPEENRAYMLASLECVDAVIIFDGIDCTTEVATIKPSIYVKGGDYDLSSINSEEREVLESVEAKIVFIPFVDGCSTTNILKRITAEENR